MLGKYCNYIIFYFKVIRIGLFGVSLGKLEKIALKIYQTDSNKIKHLPIDRIVVSKYLNEILSLDKLEFILFNLNFLPSTYTTQLLVCIPELWEDITYENFITIFSKIRNKTGLHSFLIFLCKFLELNGFDFLNESTVESKIKKEISNYFKNHPNLLEKDTFEYDSLTKESVGVDIQELYQLKLKFLKDKRIKEFKNKSSAPMS